MRAGVLTVIVRSKVLVTLICARTCPLNQTGKADSRAPARAARTAGGRTKRMVGAWAAV